ncbi:hypothetical protein Hdeb2414_s0008g00288271 [Helianthus debilis subsp. tardiflorus]
MFLSSFGFGQSWSTDRFWTDSTLSNRVNSVNRVNSARQLSRSTDSVNSVNTIRRFNIEIGKEFNGKIIFVIL